MDNATEVGITLVHPLSEIASTPRAFSGVMDTSATEPVAHSGTDSQSPRRSPGFPRPLCAKSVVSIPKPSDAGAMLRRYRICFWRTATYWLAPQVPATTIITMA